MRTRACVLIFLLEFSTIISGQRWVWGSERSPRHLPAAPSLAQPSPTTPGLTRLPRFSASPSQLEPLDIRPLAIDISKLPLETTEASRAPSSAGDVAPLTLPPTSPTGGVFAQRLDSLSRQQEPEGERDVTFDLPGQKPLEISSFNIRGPQVSHAQALVTAPDISQLPLQGPQDTHENFHALAFHPAASHGFQGGPSVPGAIVFPQRIEAFTADEGRSLQPVPVTSTRPIVAPRPVRLSVAAIPSIDTPSLKKVQPELKKPTSTTAAPKKPDIDAKQSSAEALKTASTDTVVFPQRTSGFSHSLSEGALHIIPAPKFLSNPDFRTSESTATSSYAFPPPTTIGGPPNIPRQHRASPQIRPEPREFKVMTMSFKKPSGLVKPRGVPPYVWLWPGETKTARAVKFSSKPSSFAL